ncbi:hypothetical protein [Botrimarina sp.]|uniref:hypothetical protein n=1 Tax=Botrimarina sp. TaxID=2795802 RepID=UPI0032EB96C0
MARNQNTFEKMRREAEKKRKAIEKRERREQRKEEASSPSPDQEQLEAPADED